MNRPRSASLKTHVKSQVIDGAGLNRIVARLAHEIVEHNGGSRNVVLIGMQTRGVHLARRIAAKLQEMESVEVPVGVLDVTLYRDDYRSKLKQPQVQVSHIPFPIEDRAVVLVDDVLYTGRTVRAALNALMDYGRPACIELAILVDRGHRELPIKADFVGKNVPTSQGEEVQVRMQESDGEDGVYLVEVRA